MKTLHEDLIKCVSNAEKEVLKESKISGMSILNLKQQIIF